MLTPASFASVSPSRAPRLGCPSPLPIPPLPCNAPTRRSQRARGRQDRDDAEAPGQALRSRRRSEAAETQEDEGVMFGSDDPYLASSFSPSLTSAAEARLMWVTARPPLCRPWFPHAPGACATSSSVQRTLLRRPRPGTSRSSGGVLGRGLTNGGGDREEGGEVLPRGREGRDSVVVDYPVAR